MLCLPVVYLFYVSQVYIYSMLVRHMFYIDQMFISSMLARCILLMFATCILVLC